MCPETLVQRMMNAIRKRQIEHLLYLIRCAWHGIEIFHICYTFWQWMPRRWSSWTLVWCARSLVPSSASACFRFSRKRSPQPCGCARAWTRSVRNPKVIIHTCSRLQLYTTAGGRRQKLLMIISVWNAVLRLLFTTGTFLFFSPHSTKPIKILF